MQLAEFLDRLGYAESPTFLRPRQNAFRIDPDFGHIFRRASETLALQGVYTLRPDGADHSPSVPIVYICEADAETKADDFHRLNWNQDVVPFLEPRCCSLRAYLHPSWGQTVLRISPPEAS